ncbi:MAG: hypothetical protein FVQ83_02775 [Chloroflexi bacterium]|nr:hypothetical protein [Chloroflexota bacterium]
MFTQKNALIGDPATHEGHTSNYDADDASLAEERILQNVILDQFSSHPENALLMGVCEDGLPLFLDLKDPSPGAILLVGDNSFGNQRHLRTILYSACKLNNPTNVNVHMISPQPEMHGDLLRKPHFLQTYKPYDEASWILIEEICNLVEHRQNGMPVHPIQFLVIDDLAMLIQDFTANQLEDFKWLLKASAKTHIWVIATLTSTNIRQAFFPIIKHFGTQVFGRVYSPSTAAKLTGSSFLDITELIPGVESVIRTGEEQFKLYIPQAQKPGLEKVLYGGLK